jgi:UDP-N-acetylglucosamine--dolichyl-phosphate N-acetylglucosaminephosphotransferase
MTHNVVQVVRQRSAVNALLQSASEKALAAAAAGGAVGPLEARTARTVHLLMSEQRAHILSLTLLAPLLGAGYALWRYNRFPSRVFVGDSFTYFAGMTLAVAGISGTYSKTLLLFFFPQLLNFIISLPQLFGIIECPRHRVPRWNPKTNLLENSRNLTVLNAILAVTGPLHERTLTRVVIGFQVACCAAAFVVRYSMAGAVYDAVR